MSTVASTVARGLDGVVVDETKVCLADKQTDRLYYRGYAIEDLAGEAGYEEVAYLLVKGDLPTRAQLEEYRQRIAGRLRALPAPACGGARSVAGAVGSYGCAAHRLLGTRQPRTGDQGARTCRGRRAGDGVPADCAAVLASPPSRRQGRGGRQQRAGCRGQSFNAAAGDAARMRCAGARLKSRSSSTRSTISLTRRRSPRASRHLRCPTRHSSFVAAISTLKGPLHGSANAAVLRFITQFKSADEAEAAVMSMLASRRRAFRDSASGLTANRTRATRSTGRGAKKAVRSGGHAGPLRGGGAHRGRKLMRASAKCSPTWITTRRSFMKNAVCRSACFCRCFFFARLPGLTAHIGEQQRGNNRLIHPSSSYTGLQPRRFLRLDER